MSITDPGRLRPLALYKELYTREPRDFAIPVTTDAAAWEAWRAAFRARLGERLAVAPGAAPPPRLLASAPPTDHGDYRRTYLEFESAPGVTVPAWLLVPAGLERPAPAVLAIHGHGYGVDDTVGIDPDGAERDAPQGFHQSFALALCRQGMVVLTPELAAFGRRREPEDVRPDEPGANSCHQATWWGLMLGRPLLGSRVQDTLRALDLLQSLPEVDAGRIGIMGGSSGGAVALLAAALEPRLRAAVVSSYFCTFRDSILAMRHCHCNYVPGLLQDGELYDIAALVAPRPLLIESGAQDPIFPLHGVLEAYEQLHGAYAALGAAAELEQAITPLGHQIGGGRAYAFLRERLTG
jgi:dienelactone hydrolase